MAATINESETARPPEVVGRNQTVPKMRALHAAISPTPRLAARRFSSERSRPRAPTQDISTRRPQELSPDRRAGGPPTPLAWADSPRPSRPHARTRPPCALAGRTSWGPGPAAAGARESRDGHPDRPMTTGRPSAPRLAHRGGSAEIWRRLGQAALADASFPEVFHDPATPAAGPARHGPGVSALVRLLCHHERMDARAATE